MNSIPASQLVNSIPGVIGTGGSPLSLNAVIVDNSGDTSIPIGVVMPFASAEDVIDWYGANTPQASIANIYFSGFTGCQQLPSSIYFVQDNTAAVAAYLRGSALGLTLAQLQGLSGTLIIAINGETVAAAAIDLSAASSPSNAAALITTGIQTGGGIFTGTAAQTASQNQMVVSAVTSGVLHIGDTVTGASVAANTTITAQVSGPAGGAGTYTVSTTTGFASTTIEVSSTAICTYDALRDAFVVTSPTTGASSTLGFASGTLAAGIKLTQATGAVTSQGAAPVTPAALMDMVSEVTQNWATFMTVQEPVLAEKLKFATWVSTQNAAGQVARFAYACYDSDPTALAASASNSFGVLTKDFVGVVPIWNPSGDKAAFFCGAAASIAFSQPNGRITFAYKSQGGLNPDVTNATIAANLIANGYNFYAAYATANQQFQFFQPGQISGDWKWADAYINQIWFNAQLQLSQMSYLAQVKAVPYNQRGYDGVRMVLVGTQKNPGTILQFKQFGGIVTGVELSGEQIAEVNEAAGLDISGPLFSAGFYLQILDPGATVRGERGPPIENLWYTDGGSVQKLTINSVDVE